MGEAHGRVWPVRATPCLARGRRGHSLENHVESNSICALQIPAPLFHDRRAVEAEVCSRDAVGLWRGLENTALAVFQHDAEPQESSRHRPGLDDTGFKELTAHHCARRASVKAGHAFLLLEHRERDIDDRVATMRLLLELSVISESRALPYPAHVRRGCRVRLARKARDEMALRHWAMSNHFVHHGRAGLKMLGFDPEQNIQQIPLGFFFDDDAETRSKNALMNELPPLIFD